MEQFRVRSKILILSAVLFCLPWIEIRCDLPNGGTIITTQSGLQTMYGGVSVTTKGKEVAEADRQKAAASAKKRQKPAFLMVVYAVCLLAALWMSFTVSDSNRQWLLVTAFSGAAAVSLVIQLALGFPLVDGIPRGGRGVWEFTIWFWFALASTISVFLISISERLKPLKESLTSDSIESVGLEGHVKDNLG